MRPAIFSYANCADADDEIMNVITRRPLAASISAHAISCSSSRLGEIVMARDVDRQRSSLQRHSRVDTSALCSAADSMKDERATSGRQHGSSAGLEWLISGHAAAERHAY